MNRLPKIWLRVCGILIFLIALHFIRPIACPNGCIMRPRCTVLVKGVIKTSYTKPIPVFYAPDFNGYNDLFVLWFLGGPWFCNIEEAKNAGWYDGRGIW